MLYWLIYRKIGVTPAAVFLTSCSLFFYGWWNFKYVFLLGGSILFNYAIYHLIMRFPEKKYAIVFVGILLNIALLFYFKYFTFAMNISNAVLGTNFNATKILLPLAISFFTFQQIAFIVDTYKGKVPVLKFKNYVLFMSFYPHLIAGPILHHSEIMPQFDEDRRFSIRDYLIPGCSRFVMGAFKKVFIADNLGMLVNVLFGAADGGEVLSFADSWAAAIGYTLQLYFDFSGYADMAIGSAMMLGIRLPENFNSPYKATSIIEFWRRWHMTLSRWLRDYLYIPLGGNRNGSVVRYRNIFITMFLGGIWHGAGYHFMIWGAIQGILIMLSHLWHSLTENRSFVKTKIWMIVGWIMTFGCVVLGWVFFRATTLSGALTVLRGMFGFSAFSSQFLSKSDMGFWSILGYHSYIPIMFIILLITLTWPSSSKIEQWIRAKAKFNSNPILLGQSIGATFAFVIASLEQGSQKFLYFDF